MFSMIVSNPYDRAITATKVVDIHPLKITTTMFMLRDCRIYSWLQHIFYKRHFLGRWNIYSSKDPKYELKTTKSNFGNHSHLFTRQWARSCWPHSTRTHNQSQSLSSNMKTAFNKNYEYWIVKGDLTSVDIFIG